MRFVATARPLAAGWNGVPVCEKLYEVLNIGDTTVVYLIVEPK